MDTIALEDAREQAEFESLEWFNSTYIGPFCYLWENPNLTAKERDALIPF